MKRVRIGVVGGGGIFQAAHLPAYPDVAEAQLKCVCDVSEEVLKNVEKKTRETYLEKARKATEKGDLDLAERLKADVENLKTYSSLNEMLSREEIDLVDICTPTKFHNLIAIESLNRGVHAMAEKPMARTYLECLEVAEAAEDNKKLYQHNENWLYLPLWYNARKFIESGVIGELQLAFLATAHGGPEWASWFWDPDVAGGGALLDMGVHAITASWFIIGFDRNPVAVKAAEPFGICIRMKTRILQGMFRTVEVEDDAHIMVRFEDEDGAWSTAHIEGSWAHRDSMETSIIGTNGIMKTEVRDENTYLTITDGLGGKREINLGKSTWVQSFAGEIRNMCNCVLNNARPICDERVGAETTAIVQAGYLSQKKGKKPVTIEEFKRYAYKTRDKEGRNAPNVLLKELLKGVRKI
ncbi:MAG: Gfo/Idh/MocA family oxidoreductase [Nitrososphaerota archaeon]